MPLSRQPVTFPLPNNTQMTNKSLSVFIFFGLIASGKSTLAKLWAEHHSYSYFSSDLTRKKLAGNLISSTSTPFKQGIYTPSFTKKTYNVLFEKASHTLQENKSVVLDASFSTIEHRQQAIQLTAPHAAKLWFVYCYCPESETRKRLAKRAHDPFKESDGTWQIYQNQKKVFCSADELGNNLISLSTMAPPENLMVRLTELINP